MNVNWGPEVKDRGEAKNEVAGSVRAMPAHRAVMHRTGNVCCRVLWPSWSGFGQVARPSRMRSQWFDFGQQSRRGDRVTMQR
jgi:hypothetical protein